MPLASMGPVALSLAILAGPIRSELHPQPPPQGAAAEAIVTNDNRHPAGLPADGVLTLDLRAGYGGWRPDGDDGPTLRVQAFGEVGSALAIPAPLIRVAEGGVIAASVRNELPDQLRVHGLCEQAGAACAPLDVPPGETRQVRFKSGPAGTYRYWATTMGMPLQFRGADDTQLSGAIVVDPTTAPASDDRVFVITEWSSLTREQLRDAIAQDDPGAAFLKLKPADRFFINGRSWPNTERLTYQLGDRAHWRVINLSTQTHPMHLHGFDFDVDSLGDGSHDKTFSADQKPHVFTQSMPSGSTMTMTWVPARAGNWLFHCHVMNHVSPTLEVDGSTKPGASAHDEHGASAGMTGMVLGITVRGTANADEVHDRIPEITPRKLTLQIESDPNRFGEAPAYGFRLVDGTGHTPQGQLPVPGPTLALTRGEPVEITLVNRLPEATAIHWHGMELDSYYDGVHGWSGTGNQVTPLIEPGGSFVVRFTPPRTGTFIYHTHLHDYRQLTSGLYGAMLVLDPSEAYDPAIDHVFVIGRGGPDVRALAVLNGESNPQTVWKSGMRHRVRLINITPSDTLLVTLQTTEGPVTWRPLTKDGVPLPPDRCEPQAAKQIISVGETYDFEYEAAPGRRTLWLELRTTGGKWQAQELVMVR